MACSVHEMPDIFLWHLISTVLILIWRSAVQVQVLHTCKKMGVTWLCMSDHGINNDVSAFPAGLGLENAVVACLM